MRTTQGVVHIADVTDGTSNTVMLGEKQLNRAVFGTSVDDDESYCTPGWNDDWEVYRWGAGQPAVDSNAPGKKSASRVFGSAHLTGFTSLRGWLGPFHSLFGGSHHLATGLRPQRSPASQPE